MKRESAMQTFKIAGLLCAICSIVVSSAAVLLRAKQNENKELDKQKNILIAAGLYDEDADAIWFEDSLHSDLDIAAMFTKPDGGKRPWVEEKIIDLATGEEIDAKVQEQIKSQFPKGYDQRKAAKLPTEKWSEPVDGTADVARLKRRENYSYVYLVHKADGGLDQIILPIRGYGLWSTLWGFIALDADLTTIRGITYYEHGETPGLGGEVDNPQWKESWKGKQAFGPEGNVKIHVIKGQVTPGSEEAKYEIDGLSGATLTSNGVSNMLKYWLGENGFGPYLDRMKKTRSSM